MKSYDVLILYETFTGNCAAYAEILAQFLSCKKMRISEFNSTDSANTIIVFSPVHAQGIPKKIKDELKICNFKGRQVIPVIVYGAVSSGAALRVLARLLIKSGGMLIGAAECVGKHSYSILAGITENILASNNAEMVEFCKFVKTAIIQKAPLRLRGLKRFSNLFSYLPKRMLAAFSVRLPVVEKHKACSDCGLCVSECPMSAINADKCINKAKCARCLQCVRICPEKARRAKFSQPFIKKYLNKKRSRKNKYYLSLPI